MTVGSKWETVDDQGGSFVQRGAAEGLSVHGGREVTEEGSARWNRRPGSAMRANPGRKGLHGHQFFNKKYFLLIG